MNKLRFYLDDELVEIESVNPQRTLLQFLREDLQRVGTKEGCAEGDCGACTVVLAEVVGQRLQFRALNACIQFLPTLDGKALYTVESLRSRAGQLHPVQQSMVDFHGSQCGFCTPGFIMSMFALYKNIEGPTRAEIDDALSGNLCRCTGYRPIVDACQHMTDYAVSVDADSIVNQRASDRADIPTATEQALIDSLTELKRSDVLELDDAAGRYIAPVSLDQLNEALVQYPQAVILAGGTDVGLWVTKQLRELGTIIYLGQIDALKQIKRSETGIEIGAAVSLSDAFAELVIDYPELGEMFRRFASVPIRNAGTLVGNVANGSPIGDSMPALIVLETQIKLRSLEGCREMSMEEFYIDYMQTALRPGEYIESITIPVRNPEQTLACYKLSKRYDQDISAICAAFAVQTESGQIVSARLAFGGMAAIPKRAVATEDYLIGKDWNETTVTKAMEILRSDFSPMSDMRASASYRSRASSNLLYRYFLQGQTDGVDVAPSVNVFEVAN